MRIDKKVFVKVTKIVVLVISLSTVLFLMLALSSCGEDTTCEHKKTKYIVDKEATCTEKGKAHTECLECGKTVTNINLPKNHDYVLVPYKAATCEEPGNEEGYICKKCDYSDVEIIPALGHEEPKWLITKEATCNEDGLLQLICHRCSKALETKTIERKEHVSSSWIYDEIEDCEKGGTQYKKCTVCGERIETKIFPPMNHVVKWKSVKEPTCEENGFRTGECVTCNKKIEEPIIATGHHQWKNGKCEKCNVICGANTNHKYHEGTCEVCGHIHGEKKLFKTWDEFTDFFLKDMTAYLKLETPLTIDNFFNNTYGKVEMLDFFTDEKMGPKWKCLYDTITMMVTSENYSKYSSYTTDGIPNNYMYWRCNLNGFLKKQNITGFQSSATCFAGMSDPTWIGENEEHTFENGVCTICGKNE